MKTYLLIVITIFLWIIGYKHTEWHKIPEPTKQCSEFADWQSRFVPARCFSNFIN